MPPFLKKTLLYLLIAAGVVCALAIWGEHRAKQWLEEKLAESGVVKYRRMHLSLLTGSLSLDDVAIDWRWVEQGKRLHLISPKISITGVSWRKLYFNRQLKLSDLRLQSPDMTMRDLPPQPATPPKPPKKEEPTVRILSLEIGNAELESGCAEVYKPSPKGIEKAIVQAVDMDMSLAGVHFDMQGDVMSSASFDGVEIRLQDVAFDNENLSHRLHLQHFSLSKEDSLIRLDGFSLTQYQPPNEFFQSLQYKEAWYEMTFPHIAVKGWHFDDLLSGKMRAAAIAVDSFDMHVRTNQNLSPDPQGYKRLPQEMLRKIPIALVVDSLLVRQGRLRFENLGVDKTEVGLLTFDPINASFRNVTNDSARIAQQKTMEVVATGYLQGKHPVYNHLWFDLASPDNVFSFQGNAGNIPFASLNSFIRPCANAAFDEGTINRISFSANADGTTANGSLTMDYENLHFSLLDDERERRKILSRIVDILFVNEENDRSDEDFEKGVIHNRRNKHLSFFNYWWTSIQSGMRTSLVKEERVEKVKKIVGKGQ